MHCYNSSQLIHYNHNHTQQQIHYQQQKQPCSQSPSPLFQLHTFSYILTDCVAECHHHQHHTFSIPAASLQSLSALSPITSNCEWLSSGTTLGKQAKSKERFHHIYNHG
ncbi:unnamed protein product [Orchesella dallaii]|uniref:Uncharacterized protein n=1 Tax=Orchesella dallaii TaxID=48710 RepID=A0ABP1RUD9_9HEXA